jgi:hypothetical protein
MSKEGVRGGTIGFPALGNEWGYSCRLVDDLVALL